MTREEKQLLLKDLCSRLPYGVVVSFKNSDTREAFNQILDYTLVHMVEYIPHIGGIEIKPYLRPMSSMTEEEADEWAKASNMKFDMEDGFFDLYDAHLSVDWLNAHHFDYRGLIPSGLALDCTNLNIY